ncbi:MAG: hypothetical protein ABSE51_20700 [Terracidiphilus sp.]|jgi:hypothetical protein
MEKEYSLAQESRGLTSSDILQQLERIVAGKHFRNSKRYPVFLRFVVEQAIACEFDSLKERTIGIQVFARSNDYDTNEDPIVRVTAGEIRKRLAQYYQDRGHEQELRIDLPLGSYVPQFLPAAHGSQLAGREFLKAEIESLLAEDKLFEPKSTAAALPEPVTKSSVHRHSWYKRLLIFGLGIVLLSGAGWWERHHLLEGSRERGIDSLWRPILVSGTPTLIVLGVHTLDSHGHDSPTDSSANSSQSLQQDMLSSMIHSDMIPISDVVSYSRITDVLTMRSHSYRTIGFPDTTLEDLPQGPIILMGALDNICTERLTAGLRYSFFGGSLSAGGIRDRGHPSDVLTFNNQQPILGNTRDYAIVASYYDHTSEQPVLVVAGLGKAGTQAAAEFLTSNQRLEGTLGKAVLEKNKNIEIVLSTEIQDGHPGPPHVLATFVW